MMSCLAVLWFCIALQCMLLYSIDLLAYYLVLPLLAIALSRFVLYSHALFAVLHCCAVVLSCHVSVLDCFGLSLLVVFCLGVHCIVVACCIVIVLSCIVLPCLGLPRLDVLYCFVLYCLYYIVLFIIQCCLVGCRVCFELLGDCLCLALRALHPFVLYSIALLCLDLLLYRIV